MNFKKDEKKVKDILIEKLNNIEVNDKGGEVNLIVDENCIAILCYNKEDRSLISAARYVCKEYKNYYRYTYENLDTNLNYESEEFKVSDNEIKYNQIIDVLLQCIVKKEIPRMGKIYIIDQKGFRREI